VEAGVNKFFSFLSLFSAPCPTSISQRTFDENTKIQNRRKHFSKYFSIHFGRRNNQAVMAT